MDAVRALRVAAVVEAVGLAVLLVNLVTVHLDAVAALAGPVHGLAYLAAIALTWTVPCSPGGRWWVLVPGVGGLIVVRRGVTPGAV